MRLSFKFGANSFTGKQLIEDLTDTVIKILEMSQVMNKDLMDRVDDWGHQLVNKGFIETDVPGGKDLRTIIQQSQGTFTFAKIALDNYLERKIKESEVIIENGQEKKKKEKVI